MHFLSRSHIKSSVMISIQAQLHINDLFSRFSHSLFLQVKLYLGTCDGVMGLPRWLTGKESTCQRRRHKRCELDPWVQQIPQRRAWNPLQCSFLGNPVDRGAWWATDSAWSHSQTEHDPMAGDTLAETFKLICILKKCFKSLSLNIGKRFLF